LNTVERRLELLRMEGLGFSRPEIVKELSVSAKVSERAIYYDFQTRAAWQPKTQQFKDVDQLYHKILNRFEQIYRKASFMFLNENNPNIKVAALKVMLEATGKTYDVRLYPEIMSKLERLEEAAAKR
jgi:hypothetical protein